ncbi:hypothetical protein ABT272_36650 [Streptomyces sp900105245]|uniref:Uncharacterized protein n=1 Tax=Streptomyces sp. 900105245 TaxID=3154379 RepID=A0ABV1UHM3_9ACTN
MTKVNPGFPGAQDTARAQIDETATVREQLLERTCEWCGEPVAYGGRGRPARYCSPVHRRRAWELRTAEARADRPVSEGGRSREPVREVVERTETVVRTVTRPDPGSASPGARPALRLSGEPYTLPSDAIEWIEALAALRREVANPRIFPFREHIARACEKTLHALRAGGSPTPAAAGGAGAATAE